MELKKIIQYHKKWIFLSILEIVFLSYLFIGNNNISTTFFASIISYTLLFLSIVIIPLVSFIYFAWRKLRKLKRNLNYRIYIFVLIALLIINWNSSYLLTENIAYSKIAPYIENSLKIGTNNIPDKIVETIKKIEEPINISAFFLPIYPYIQFINDDFLKSETMTRVIVNDIIYENTYDKLIHAQWIDPIILNITINNKLSVEDRIYLYFKSLFNNSIKRGQYKSFNEMKSLSIDNAIMIISESYSLQRSSQIYTNLKEKLMNNTSLY